MKKLNVQALILDASSVTFILVSLYILLSRPSEEMLLNLKANAASTFTLWMGALVVMAATAGRYKTLGKLLFAGPEPLPNAEVPIYRQFWGIQLLLVLIVAFVVGLRVTEFSFVELLDERGLAGAQRIFHALLRPDYRILPQAVLAIIETLFIAFMATLFALPVAFVLSFVCAKNLVGKTALGLLVYYSLRSLLNFARSIEPLIWAIIFSVWVGIGPFAGMLALFLHSVVSLTKNYSELVEGISDGPIEAIEATGATPLQVIWYAVVPQIVLPYTAFTIYRWDINVRMATVIGLVGGGGIGTMLIQYQGQAMWEQVGCLVAVVATVVWLLDAGSAAIRQAIK